DAPAVPASTPRADLTPEEKLALARQALAARAARPRVAPATFAQERLWFLHQMEPDSPAYNISSAWRLSGPLDARGLARALERLVERHEALRTTLAVRDGAPVQVIAPPAAGAAAGTGLDVTDLCDLPADERLATAGRLAEAEAHRPFDLERGPLFRPRLLRLAADDHVLVLTLHHAVGDGWSMGVLYRDLSALYAAALHGGDAALPGLPIQYADYAAWQHRQLAGEALAAEVEHWRGRLADAPPLLELPADRPRPAAQSYRGAQEPLALPPGLVAPLAELAREQGATLFMALLAAWQALLARWSGQDDVVVGTAVAGRGRAETEGLIGFFVNTLALRGDLSGNPGFRELLARVRRETLDAFAHADAPFERVVEALRPDRSPGYHPVFQVMFNLAPPPAGPAFPGIRAQRLEVERWIAKFDLSAELSERPDGGVQGWVRYGTQLFDAATVRRLLGHLRRLLEGAVAQPDRPVADLPLLDEAERRTLEESGRRADAYDARCLHEMFAAQAARTPDAVAVAAPEGETTFRALDERSTRLARLLRGLGVGPEVRVGLVAEKSTDTLAALLAILKAGGAYVPVDEDQPAERLLALLRDCGARIVVAPERLHDVLAAAGHRVVHRDGRQAAGESAEPVESGAGPRNLAYVIYTSGSTGAPKGVMVEHASVSRYVQWAAEVLLDGVGRVTALSRPSFDGSLKQLVSPLLRGGPVWLLPPEATTDPAVLLAELRAHDGVALNCVPSLAATVLDAIDAGEPAPRLARLAMGGEALPDALLERARRIFPETEIWNMYGPTETTVNSTAGPVPPGKAVSLGPPLPGTSLYVLDGRGRPQPAGVPGELYVGGSGVTRGYLGRPALTAERFVPDPFSTTPGARLYRTGDRVRWRESTHALTHSRTHALEYLGRTDFQVKVRGFRIEPGEVEAVLAAHPGVRQAVVTARDGRLVAYAAGEPGLDPGALRGWARERLPEHMVPATVVVMDALPLNRHGKVDRRALPEPEAERTDGYVPPRTPAETLLAEVWAEVLGVERVGAEDGFFALGGHSLLAARAVSRIRAVFGCELPLRSLFEQPTLAALAAEIERTRADRPALPPVERANRHGPLPLSFAQQRLWFLDRLQPGSPLYNVPAALRLTGELNGPALARALGEIVRRHESLRTTFAGEGAEARQVIAPPTDDFALPFENLSSHADRRAEALRRAREEAEAPFDLARGPLFRARLLRLAADEHVLLLTLHHAVSDGWSTGVLVRELSALYAAFAEGRPSPLPEPPVQYADFAVWQRRALQGPALEAQLAYWKARLAGAPAVLALPADHPRPAVRTHRGGCERLELPAEAARAVRELGRREGATLFMTLLAAWQALLARHAGQDDVVVGTPVAGRTRGEIEGLIGFFVNTLALRGDLSGDPSFRELLARARHAALDAWAHQDVPFERVVEEVQPDRTLGHTPVFQALLTLQDGEDRVPALPGLHVERLPVEQRTVKFDLSLAATDRADGLGLALWYDADLFEASTARQMLERLALLLAAAAAEPGRRLSALPLLTDAERARVEAWQAGPALPPSIDPFPAQWAARVAEAPEAVALVHGDASLTRAELDARANRLARHLRRLGVGPEVIVGVAMERTPELIVTLLAVLKAGGAYAPMEPHFPPDRIRTVLASAGARVLAASASVIGRVGLPDGCRALAMDDPRVRAAVDAEDPAAPEVGIHPEMLSHVIYTSGSTGTPKGVMIRHGAVAAFTDWMRARFPLEPGERVLMGSAISFDAQLAELHFPLAAGAPILLVHDTLAVAELPADARVAQASMVATAARELLALGRIPAGLRRLNQGGEPLSADLVRGLYAAGVEEVNNFYGPTEDTTYSTHARCTPDGPITIGRPLGGRRAYVLDGALRPVPAGVAGDLYLAGCGVARGYAGRPDLTAERFVPDPFGAPGERMYASGDRARWRANGEIEYLGRADLQVKVRGFRIEPGEVESVLRAHPSVADAAVGVRGAGVERRLVAWAVPRDGAAIDPSALIAHAAERLPRWMVPAAVVAMEAFPRTVSGKVDRRALPEPAFATDAAEYVAPRTPAERVVAEVFAQVLGAERVGATDDFFTLGGHSLLAMHVWAHLRDRCGAELPLRALFEHPTVQALAAAVDAAPRIAVGEAEPRIVPGPRTTARVELGGGRSVEAYAAPASFSQQRLWMLDQLEPGRTTYAVPVALRLRGPLDAGALQRALDALVERHESLRTVFQGTDAGPMQVVLPRGALPVEAIDLAPFDQDAREAELRRRLAEQAARPFDLAAGPLARACLYRLGGDEHVLLVNLHHVVTDGWSNGVLLREMAALYGAFSAGADSPLAGPALQYADWARWQRERLRGALYDAHRTYWKNALADAPALLELPTDRPRPAVWEGRGAAERFRLPREMADAVQALARAEGCTPFMVLLAAFQALLGRYARQEDVVVGTPVANRTRPETQDVVGFFVNTLALRADLSCDPTFRALLHRVRDTVLGAFAHQEMPFERLVDELKVPRSAAHSPVFQVMFVLQTAGDGDASLPGLAVERVPVEGTHAPFDLTLALRPRADGMDGVLEYATALFDRATALRLLDHFRTLLAAACDAPDAPVSSLPLLSADEVDAALRAWEGPALESTFTPIHDRIAARAARTPHAVAVEGGGERLTYAQLEDRASRLAHRLRALGVQPGVIAAVRAERSVEAVVAIVAVLKAGGAYLPLDPSLPAERQAYMLADSGAALLLDGTGAPAPHGWAGRVADLTTELAAAADTPAIPYSLFPIPCSPDDLAYVIYTSGSTGRPKGVAVPHRCLSAYVDAARQAYALTPADRCLQFAPLSFDSSVEELFAPLAAGATMVLRDEEMLSVDGFWRACGRLSLTIATLPTAYWHELAAAMDRAAPAVPPSLRIMIIGGERALPERVASWRRGVGPWVRLINSYGPTETTVAATLHDVAEDGATVPIGRPMPGYRVRVLDASLRPVPPGVPGELFVGGIGVARGYLHRPGTTAARFVPDPFAARPGERLYRTGDLVRWTESASVRECVSASVGAPQEAGHEQRSQPPFT
ncbi:MAG TPA: amino acid adenylation domain-containing protein, partial [Longimicrobium sp.]|nr:amino acid adenylation domain-containing protein [Longimicrobium sp.]